MRCVNCKKKQISSHLCQVKCAVTLKEINKQKERQSEDTFCNWKWYYEVKQFSNEAI